MYYTSKEVYEYISKHIHPANGGASDPIVERKQCRVSGQDFPIYQSDLDFYDKISPKFEVSLEYAKKFLEENKDITENFEYEDGKLKCKIPTPTLCPEERQRRRLAFRNERKLYKRTCDFSWKEIISIYSPDKPYKVYDQSIWRSDKWDAMDYWVDFDINKSFFSLYKNVFISTPLLWLTNVNAENSEYCNYSEWMKDCYLEVGGVDSENVYYSYTTISCKNTIDNYLLTNSNNCYECIMCHQCSNLFWSQYCENCHDSSYLTDCKNCNFCHWCSGLINKKYCIWNQQYTKEEYEKVLKNTTTMVSNKDILPYARINNSENIIGNNIATSSNSTFVHDVLSNDDFWQGVENCKYHLITWYNITNSYDCLQSGMHMNASYEVLSTYKNVSNILFGIWCIDNASHLIYCNFCYTCSHCFGCVWLRNKEYCIFNKQYTKEEYNELVPKIIAQMIKEGQRWEFFDPQLSPFWYNETVAMEYYPLTKEEALKLWYKWSDYEAPFPKVEKYVQGKKLRTASCKTIHEQKPELLEKLLNYAVVCEVSGRPFRIIKQEIDFYIKHDLPLPKKHPDIRHQERMDKRPWRTLYLRNCDKCGEEMLSVYPSSWGSAEGSSTQQIDSSLCLSTDKAGSEWQKIYCESCYQKEIYG